MAGSHDTKQILVLLDGVSKGAFETEWSSFLKRKAPPRELVRLAFHHLHSMVYATALRILGDPYDAEDMVQSVFESFVRRAAAIKDPKRVPGFLKTCTVRGSLKQIRRRQLWRRFLFSKTKKEVEIETTGPDVEVVAEVKYILSFLDPEERIAVILKHIEGHTLEEIEDLMSVSLSTTRRRLNSAAEKIKALQETSARRALLKEMR